MPLIKAGKVSQLPPGSVTEVEVAGRTIALCNAGGSICAMDGVCPHEGGPLGQGTIHGDMVVCPWHAWEYNCRTGENDYDPTIRVETFPVQVDGDEILVDVLA